jgi:hypothetical protein
MLHRVPGFPARLAHMSRTGTAAEYCESVQFLARREFSADRDEVFVLLTAQVAVETQEAR